MMSPIYTLSIACVTGRHLTEEYRFVLEVPADLTLVDLAAWILGTADFEGDHLDDFFLANSAYGRKTWLTADGEWDPDDGDVFDRRLCDLFPLPRNKKLYYDYDPGASWRFEIVKKGKETRPLPDVEYPRLVSTVGVAPLEYGPDEDDWEEEEDEDEAK